MAIRRNMICVLTVLIFVAAGDSGFAIDGGWEEVSRGVPGSAAIAYLEFEIDEGREMPQEERELTYSIEGDIFLFHLVDGAVEKIGKTGMPNSPITSALNVGKMLFAAADDKVFQYIAEDGLWRPVFEEAVSGRILSLKAGNDDGGRECLWVVAEKGVYKRDINAFHGPGADLEIGRVYGNFIPCEAGVKEPTILEVQEMAVEYAEVSPEKIKRWRAGARWKAAMPKLSLSFSESVDDNIDIYKSSTTSYVVTAPREVDNDWGIDLTWDLSDLVWNESQTSIDVRSKLMVQLRDDILEEVTRLYFERKRLMAELESLEFKAHPSTSLGTGNPRPRAPYEIFEKRLRIEELTAHIDALTGGKFSQAIGSK